MGVALKARDVTKRFGGRTAFSEVSFSGGNGEVFGFLGPNGAGKATTVRTLGTLTAPTSGSAIVGGVPLVPEHVAEIRQPISIILIDGARAADKESMGRCSPYRWSISRLAARGISSVSSSPPRWPSQASACAVATKRGVCVVDADTDAAS